MENKVNLADKLALDEPYSPGIVGYLNDYKLCVVKTRRVRLAQARRDRRFLPVLRGRLTIEPVTGTSSCPRASCSWSWARVEHRPVAHEEAHVLLIEPSGTVNTGDGGDLTAEESRI